MTVSSSKADTAAPVAIAKNPNATEVTSSCIVISRRTPARAQSRTCGQTGCVDRLTLPTRIAPPITLLRGAYTERPQFGTVLAAKSQCIGRGCREVAMNQTPTEPAPSGNEEHKLILASRVLKTRVYNPDG